MPLIGTIPYMYSFDMLPLMLLSHFLNKKYKCKPVIALIRKLKKINVKSFNLVKLNQHTMRKGPYHKF